MERAQVVLLASTLLWTWGGCERAAPRPTPTAPAARPTPTAPAAAPAPRPTMAPCSGPGYRPGPAVEPIRGQAPFEVTFNCMWPTQTRLEIALARTETTPLSRDGTASLLRAVWSQLHASLGKRFPRTVQLCLFPAGTRSWGSNFLGCMKQGYEPEGEAGEEDEVEMHLAGPIDSAEWVKELASALGRVAGAHPRISFDDQRRELTVTYPYGGAKGKTVSLADALVPFFAIAYRFYPPATRLQALTFVGTWNGKPVVTVHVSDPQTFLRMDPWPMRERLAQAKVPYEPGGRRTPEQAAMIARAYQAALAKLPAGSVRIDSHAVAMTP